MLWLKGAALYGHAQASLLYGQLLFENGQYQLARQQLSKLDLPQAKLLMAKLHLNKFELTQAQQLLNKLNNDEATNLQAQIKQVVKIQINKAECLLNVQFVEITESQVCNYRGSSE